jgi:hypothetical protein
MLLIAAVTGACGAEAPSEEQEAVPVAAEEQVQPGQEAEPGAAEAREPHEQTAQLAADRMEGIISQSGTSEAPMLRLRPAEGRAVGPSRSRAISFPSSPGSRVSPWPCRARGAARA